MGPGRLRVHRLGAATGIAGGSHCGLAGHVGCCSGGDGNTTYGATGDPTDMGSGAAYGWNYGGDGGGRIDLTVGSLALNGTIVADGGLPPADIGRGSGSGGTIWVKLPRASARA
jgi:hypothetical protein